MASSGNTWFKKLEAKQARWRQRQNGNTFTPLLARATTPHHEKLQAFKAQSVLISKGLVIAAIHEGDGLPDEVLKVAKTNAERAAEDKRKPLPMKPSWVPRPYGKLNRRRLVA
jgi:hypothetical protein